MGGGGYLLPYGGWQLYYYINMYLCIVDKGGREVSPATSDNAIEE